MRAPISIRYIFFLLFMLMGQKLHAEYRAYQYVVSPTGKEQKKMTIITSSLTPVAMTRYYGIKKDQLYLVRTWICPGYTARKNICVPPYQDDAALNAMADTSGAKP